MRKRIVLLTAVLLTVLISGCGNPVDEVRSLLKNERIEQLVEDLPAEKPSAVVPADQPESNGPVQDLPVDEPGDGPFAEGPLEEPSAAEPANENGANNEEEALLDPSLTVAGLKALNYSVLKARAVYLVDQFLNNTVPKNPYSNLSFRHDGSLLSYNEPGYDYLLGVDVSVFQGEIDWAALKAQGISFAIIRVGYRGYGESGSLNEDELFRQNIAGAREAGLLVGAYFFSQAVSAEEAKEEAGYMLSLLDGTPLDLPIVFDEEIIRDDDARTDQMLLSQFNENALAFFEEIQAAGYTPMLYTNLLFECLIYDLEKFSGIPIWFAGYEPLPLTPYHFDIWQYTESGTLDGVEGPVDLNIWIRNTGM